MNIRSYIARSGWYGNAWILALTYSETSSAHGLVLHQQDGALKVEASAILESEAAVQEWLGRYPQSPIVLAVHAEQAAEAFIAADASDPVSAVLQVQIAGRQHFVWQCFEGETQVLTALMRKDALKDFIHSLGDAQQRLVSISLSPAVVTQLIPALEGYESDHRYQLGEYGFQQGKIVQGAGIEIEPYELQEALGVEQASLYPFGAAVHYLSTQGDDLHNLEELTLNRRLLHRQWQWLRTLLITGLVLLVTWGAANSARALMQDTIDEAAILSQSNAQSLNKIEVNRAQLRQQQTFLQNAQGGSLQARQYALLIDRMASVCPTDVHFTTLILPVEAQDWKKLDLPGEMPGGLLMGFTVKASALTRFNESLQTLPQLIEPTLIQGAYDRRTDTYPFSITFDLPLPQSTQP